MSIRTAPLCTLAFAALGSAAALAQTPDLPTRKAGLWEMVMRPDGGAGPQTMQHCTDEATDKAMSTMFGGPMQQACTQQTVQRSANSITIDSACSFGNMKSVSRSVITGDFSSAYTVKVDSRTEGAMMPGMPQRGESSMTIDAKWVGPCKADQKPGDIVMPGGMKMNIADMQKLRNMMGPQGGGMMAPGGAMAPKGGMMAPQK